MCDSCLLLQSNARPSQKHIEGPAHEVDFDNWLFEWHRP